MARPDLTRTLARIRPDPNLNPTRIPDPDLQGRSSAAASSPLLFPAACCCRHSRSSPPCRHHLHCFQPLQPPAEHHRRPPALCPTLSPSPLSSSAEKSPPPVHHQHPCRPKQPPTHHHHRQVPSHEPPTPPSPPRLVSLFLCFCPKIKQQQPAFAASPLSRLSLSYPASPATDPPPMLRPYAALTSEPNLATIIVGTTAASSPSSPQSVTVNRYSTASPSRLLASLNPRLILSIVQTHKYNNHTHTPQTYTQITTRRRSGLLFPSRFRRTAAAVPNPPPPPSLSFHSSLTRIHTQQRQQRR